MPEIDIFALNPFLLVGLFVALIMLFWDTIEVGKNDAANIVNSVFGARILARRLAVGVAGIGVILGASLSSDVIETARKGIFAPGMFSIYEALSIYISVYIVDTILLYTYSAFGMPVSTTMTLVFELLGASLFLGIFKHDPVSAVKWNKAGIVILGIVCSIILSGVMGFILQRAARGAIRDKYSDMNTLLLHGGWVGGGLMAGLSYFMLVKGMKNVAFIKYCNAEYLSHPYAPIFFFLGLWVLFAVLIHFLLVVFQNKTAKVLFPVLTVIGMICMAFAFGQNDLANCASPGLAVVKLIEGSQQSGLTTADITKVPISGTWLFLCGFLLVVGMFTKSADRVTKAEVRTGSRSESHMRLYAPKWCVYLGSKVAKLQKKSIKPLDSTIKGKEEHTRHYDPLRACVIVCVSASVIATASALGLPVSTTYVAFAAVLATGMADRIYAAGEADLKIGRAIWVVFSWFAAAMLATVLAGGVCLSIYYFGVVGIAVCLGSNLVLRFFVGRWGDRHQEKLRLEHKRMLGLN